MLYGDKTVRTARSLRTATTVVQQSVIMKNTNSTPVLLRVSFVCRHKRDCMYRIYLLLAYVAAQFQHAPSIEQSSNIKRRYEKTTVDCRGQTVCTSYEQHADNCLG